MKGVQFGRSVEYGAGTRPCVANNTRTVLAMHQENAGGLVYRLGRPTGAIVQWGAEVPYVNGREPGCAINNNGIAVEIHRSRANEDLLYTVGRINGDTLAWMPNSRIDSGVTPKIALNDQNVVVEVHQWSDSRKEIVYRVGRIDPVNLITTWGAPQRYDNGVWPHISINSRGVVLEVHQSEGKDALYYRIGDLEGNFIRWRSGAKEYTSGTHPSVALADDGFVVEVHKSEAYDRLWCRYGLVTDSDSIQWTYTSAGAQFDDGSLPSVSCSGHMAVQTHANPSNSKVYYSTSRIVDRSRWMSDRLAVMGHNTLKDISFPGSHNAAMYDPTDDGLVPGYPTGDRDQNLTVYEQLGQGVRFFDLRPKWTRDDIYIYHGNTVGPLLSSVLSDVQKFMNEGNRELVILTLTHYEGFDSDSKFQTLTSKIQSYLGRWTYKRSANDSRRLADIPLSEYLGTGVVLPVSAGDYYYNHPVPGIYVYRTADSGDAAKGDLVVYDKYSDSGSYDYMSQDQINKFNNFNGKCDDGVTPCDLFLLSWTLTREGSAFPGAMEADSQLGIAMSGVTNPNSHGRSLNITYLDFTQSARPVDVCLTLYESKRQPAATLAPARTQTRRSA